VWWVACCGVMMPGYKAGTRIAECLCQGFPQTQTGPEKAHFDVGLCNSERVGCFSNGETFHVAQQEDQSMVGVEGFQCSFNQLCGLAALDQMFRRIAPVGDVFRMRDWPTIVGSIGGFIERHGGKSIAFSNDFKCSMCGDASEPGAESGFTTKRIEIFKSTEERLLGDVFGVLRMLQDTEGEGINGTFVMGDQGFEGGSITSSRQPQQFFFSWDVHQRGMNGGPMYRSGLRLKSIDGSTIETRRAMSMNPNHQRPGVCI
jgi:hypothetical protein